MEKEKIEVFCGDGRGKKGGLRLKNKVGGVPNCYVVCVFHSVRFGSIRLSIIDLIFNF